MKVILAEKPSVAREIAEFVGARSRRDSYLEGGGYQVTWAFGHLVELKEPEDYDPALKRWSLETLPFVPERFELKLVNDKRSRQQFNVIKRLFHAADEIICATDAGREGELIFRYILAMAGCEKKPFQRLWLSSLTAVALREAFIRLRPGSEYDRLYAAAKCRSEADWIVGLNATRNYTVRHGASGVLWSVGRVQTPVLAMIVGRDDEIRIFRKEPFWELITSTAKSERAEVSLPGLAGPEGEVFSAFAGERSVNTIIKGTDFREGMFTLAKDSPNWEERLFSMFSPGSSFRSFSERIFPQ